jgi:probable rRNA maturation factor
MIQAELNQQSLRGGQRLPRVVLERVLKEVSKELGVKKTVFISIAFVDKKTMKSLNKTYRGKDAVTDVLSFTLGSPDLLGELILSYDQAKIQAKEQKHSVRMELAFLIVHGLLHLHGYDHEQPKDAKRMFPIQERILTTLGINPAL